MICALQTSREKLHHLWSPFMPEDGGGRDRLRFVGPDVDVEAMVARQRQQAIDHFEAILPTIGIIDANDLHELLIFQPFGVAKQAQRIDGRFTLHVQLDLADLLDSLDQPIAELLPAGLNRGTAHA